MGCSSCSSGGCGSGSAPAGCGSNGSCTTGGCGKLEVFDWLAGMQLPSGQRPFDLVEVKFKNTRKDFFRVPADTEVHQGEAVVVGAVSGYDIGVVSLTGELVRIQMRKRGLHPDGKEARSILRKPDQADLDRWKEARSLEKSTMLRSRLIAQELKLQMKISDVEYQADRSKATFYYTADDRVDFRELIKLLADQFRVRIEMRQIGTRQEAGRLGGIGSCGRELCCSTWLTDFRSVSTSAARYQQLSINPMKLAGQCGKLKCCLNYELDAYLDAIKGFPSAEVRLRTAKGEAEHQKSDIFKGLMWYTYPDQPAKFYCLEIDRVHEIIEQNRSGKKPADLADFELVITPDSSSAEPDIANVVGQDSLTRFDQERKGNKRRKKKRKPGSGSGKGGGSQAKASGNKPSGQKSGNPKQGNKKPSGKRSGKRPNNRGGSQKPNNPQS